MSTDNKKYTNYDNLKHIPEFEYLCEGDDYHCNMLRKYLNRASYLNKFPKDELVKEKRYGRLGRRAKYHIGRLYWNKYPSSNSRKMGDKLNLLQKYLDTYNKLRDGILEPIIDNSNKD